MAGSARPIFNFSEPNSWGGCSTENGKLFRTVPHGPVGPPINHEKIWWHRFSTCAEELFMTVPHGPDGPPTKHEKRRLFC
jgi:hypothetical protein